MMLSFLLLFLIQQFVKTNSFLRDVSAIRRIRRCVLKSSDELIVGINKYSHDTGCCILSADTGKILFAQTKERYSRKKHDGGDCSLVVKEGLKAVGGKLRDVSLVVANNHHYRVQQFERRLPFATSIHYEPKEYMNIHNLFPQARHLELSHHLAHVWSGISGAPFPTGLVVVMDGMGESYHAMQEDLTGIEQDSGDYMHDLKLMKQFPGESMKVFPQDLSSSGSRYREAESGYIFDTTKGIIKPIFKHWTRERSPPELYNSGFENMESLGAIYSRISSHLLGDWNACGKVMGLSAWHQQSPDKAKDWFFHPKISFAQFLKHGNTKPDPSTFQFLSGNPVTGTYQVHWDTIESLSFPNQFHDLQQEQLEYFTRIAQSMQTNLNTCGMDMMQSLQTLAQAHGNTGKDLVFVGGVALNSVLNGKIHTSGLFDQVHIPCAPGDEGIALGCALYGYHRYQQDLQLQQRAPSKQPADTPDMSPTPIQQQQIVPYQGRHFTTNDIADVLDEANDWFTIEQIFSSEQALVDDAAAMIASQHIVAWFQGSSEVGQRALGHRSLLAHPGNVTLRRILNENVKKREWFRPFAPSILAEHVPNWFVCTSNDTNLSPFMSFTVPIQPAKVCLIPAVAHIDHTARLQTVTAQQSPLYAALLEAFYRLTGIPMVLNTSLNGKEEPIVETPQDALRFILQAAGTVDYLYLGNYKIRVKEIPSVLLSEQVDTSRSAGDAAMSEEKLGDMLSEVKVDVLSTVYLQERISSIHSLSSTASMLKLQVTSPLISLSKDVPIPFTEFSNILAGELLLQLQREMQENPMNITFSVLTLWQNALMKEGLTHARWKNKKDIYWKQFREALLWLHYHGYIAVK